jgi:hypothetical protein
MGVDIHAAAPDCKDVQWLLGIQCQPSEG